MTTLRGRLRDRLEDVGDWLDYRPDPNFWPLLALPFLFVAVYELGTAIGFGIVLFVALLATGLVAAFGLVALVGWVVCAALGDCASARLSGVRPARRLISR